MKSMKREEQLAYNYLTYQGYSKIKYEPDGNIPPDFLINETIAIEVRRLNQHYTANLTDLPDPLEKLEFALIPRVNSILKEYPIGTNPNSVFVFVEFGRPLTVNKKLLNDIKSLLEQHKMNDIHVITSVKISENLTIRFHPSSKKFSTLYVLGIVADNNSGGLVVSNIYHNLKLVIKEKERKILKYYNRYPEWWLLLIDFIGYGLDDFDFHQLGQYKINSSKFKKIILVPPFNIKDTKEIKI